MFFHKHSLTGSKNEWQNNNMRNANSYQTISKIGQHLTEQYEWSMVHSVVMGNRKKRLAKWVISLNYIRRHKYMYHNVFLCLLEVREGWLVGLDILVLSTVIRLHHT